MAVMATKKQLTEQCRTIIARWPHDSEVNGSDREFVLDLLQHHPDADEAWLKELPTARLSTGSNAYGTKSFFLQFRDGTKTDVSWTKAVRNAPRG
jgi:hypothetical protein